MKILKYLAIVALLCIVSAVSCHFGKIESTTQHTKDYEAACLQADFIRFIIDEFDGETEMANIGMEIENSYEEFFQDLDNYNIWKTSKIHSIKDFKEYYWCY